MTDIRRRLREMGFAETVQPSKMLRQSANVERVVDETGAVVSSAVRPFITPQIMQFASGTGSYQRVYRAGTISLFSSFAVTPPSSGDAIITLYQVTKTTGSEAIATVTIPNGIQFGETTTSVTVPAGALLLATVTTPSGASTVSSFVAISI